MILSQLLVLIIPANALCNMPDFNFSKSPVGGNSVAPQFALPDDAILVEPPLDEPPFDDALFDEVPPDDFSRVDAPQDDVGGMEGGGMMGGGMMGMGGIDIKGLALQAVSAAVLGCDVLANPLAAIRSLVQGVTKPVIIESATLLATCFAPYMVDLSKVPFEEMAMGCLNEALAFDAAMTSLDNCIYCKATQSMLNSIGPELSKLIFPERESC